MIFQDPMTSLNPVHSVGRQLVEAVILHEDVSKKQARARAIEALKEVGIPRADRRIDDYPHQFSGGMRQRAMIAMAMINDPKLLIADEPTTALDVTTQAQILSLMQKLQDDHGTAIVMITHDLGVVAETAHDVVVMYRQGDRARHRRRDLQRAAASLHLGPARLAAAARRRRRAPHADSRSAAVAAQPAPGLPLPSTMSVRDGGLQAEGARAGASAPTRRTSRPASSTKRRRPRRSRACGPDPWRG